MNEIEEARRAGAKMSDRMHYREKVGPELMRRGLPLGVEHRRQETARRGAVKL